MQQFGENRLDADAEKSDSQSPIIEAEIVEPLDAELVDQSIVEAVAPIETGSSEESLQSSITPTSQSWVCLLYTSPSPRDATLSRMPSSA